MFRFLQDLLDLIYPPRQACPLCGGKSEKAGVCPDCSNVLAACRDEPLCPVCGRFYAAPRGLKPCCAECRHTRWPFRLHRAAGPYEGLLKSSVQRLKYGRRRALARPLAGLMGAVVKENPDFGRADILVPVPLSAKRLGERGFNQAEALAGELSSLLALPLVDALRKVRETSPQTGLARRAREENLRDAFSLRPGADIRDKSVILVDDVFTTGATMSAAAGELLRGGAGGVLGLTLAAGRTVVK